MRRAIRAALVAVMLVMMPIAPAFGTEVSSAELAELAQRAIDDASALERLRAVDEVDGREVPMDALLSGSDAQIEARLRVLAEQPPVEVVDARRARADAQRVLARDKFQPEDVPRPLRGLLTWLGDQIVAPIQERLTSWFDDFARLIPGGRPVAWAIVAALVALVAWAGARRWTRVRVERKEPVHAEHAESLDPSELEGQADAAEARGELERAMRLRFRAGLLRLDQKHVIEFRPSLTSYEVARVVRSTEFDVLARDFDEVVYGRRPPSADDVRASKQGWQRVLTGGGR